MSPKVIVEDERLECQFHFLQAPEIDLPEATYENRLPDLCMNQRNDRYRADSIPSLIYRIHNACHAPDLTGARKCQLSLLVFAVQDSPRSRAFLRMAFF